MAYRYLENLDARLFNAIYKIGSEQGIENITAIRLAEECDVSNFTAASHFGSMRGALVAAFLNADKEIKEWFYEELKTGASHEVFWSDFVDMLLANRSRTFFYCDFIVSPKLKFIGDHVLFSDDKDVCNAYFGKEVAMYFWTAICCVVFGYAVKVIKGDCAGTEEEKNALKKAILAGVDSLKN